MKLIVGLGNPGIAYSATRHNVGFMCIDHISRQAGITLSNRRRLVTIGQGALEKQDIALAKPRTFMNNSGQALSYLQSKFHVPIQDILVIYDDLALPLGKIRIRPSGGAGGHRGIESIISTLSGQDFPRIRIGIGTPLPGIDQIAYVLGRFGPKENQVIQETIPAVGDAVVDIMVKGLDWAMNRHN